MEYSSFTFVDWFEIIAFFGVFLAIAPFLGKYIANVLEGKKTLFHVPLNRIELLTYRIAKIDPNEEMTTSTYAWSLISFNVLAILFAFCVLIFQGFLPLNPERFPGLSWDKALNSAIGYVAGAHWQPYAPETHLSHFSHLAGPTLQSFFSGATGIALLAALSRGISRNKETTLGNFWADFVRSTLYVFLPLAIFLSICLVIQGVIQSFDPYTPAVTLEGMTQIIPQGPAATEIAIGQLSGSGGSFFNVGRAHPLENPSALSNFFENLAMLILPGALPFTFGHLVKSKAQGVWLFGVMFVLLLSGFFLGLWGGEYLGEKLQKSAILVGKESRIGVANSTLWTTISSATGNGSLNSTLGTASPITQTIAFFNILSGNVIFGPPGIGISTLFYYIGIAVFLSGLLVGRTPEFLGKQLDWTLMRWIAIGLFIPNILILIGTSLSTLGLEEGHSPQEFSKLAYIASSIIRLNGSTLGGFNWDAPFYNFSIALGMVLAWIFTTLPVLAIAGRLVTKRIYPAETMEFAILDRRFATLLTTIIFSLIFIIFFPLLLIGPLAENLFFFWGGS